VVLAFFRAEIRGFVRLVRPQAPFSAPAGLSQLDGEKAVEYYQRFVGMSKEKVAPTHPVFANIAQAKKLPPKNPPPAPAAPAASQDAGKNVKVPAKKAEPTKKGATNVKKKN
jgi:hypothetical protein